MGKHPARPTTVPGEELPLRHNLNETRGKSAKEGGTHEEYSDCR